MKNKFKTLAATAALGIATVGVYSGTGIADTTTPVVPAASLSPATTTNAKMLQMKRVHCKKMMKIHHNSPWKLGLNHNKRLTPADAKTITKAALLMKGRHKLQVGQVQAKTIRNGRKIYLINIVNKNNKVIQRVVMNSTNGHIHPAHRLQAPQKRSS